jgi:phosphoglycolate phosphatase-like HAD superfamily hydrolase
MGKINLILDFNGVILDSAHEILTETYNTFAEIDPSVTFLNLGSQVFDPYLVSNISSTLQKSLKDYPEFSLGFLGVSRSAPKFPGASPHALSVTLSNIKDQPLGKGVPSDQELEKKFDEIFSRRYSPCLLSKCISKEIKSVINILSYQVDQIFIISNTPYDLLNQFCDRELKGVNNYKALGRLDQMNKFDHLLDYIRLEESSQHEISHNIYVVGTLMDLREVKKDPDRLAFIGVDWGYGALGVEEPLLMPSTPFREEVLKSERYVYTPFELVHVVEEILKNRG